MPSYRLPQFIEDLSVKTCFVCDEELNGDNYTLEHLIPQWIIRAFKLEKETVTLPDGSKVRYLDYLAPCCRECNCHLLSPIEATLARVFKGARVSPHKIPVRLLAIWACKIFAGVRLYESECSRDDQLFQRPLPFSEDAIDGEVASVDLCKFFLKMLRGQVRLFHQRLEFPFTVFIFDTKLPRQHRERFDYRLVHELQALYVRLGRWSMLCRFDGGYLALHGRHFFRPYLGRKLAPLQTEELAAHFFTMAERQAYPLLYVRRRTTPEEIEYIPLEFNRPFVEPGDSSDLGFWLAYFTRQPLECVLQGNRSWTCLLDASGKFLNVPADAGHRSENPTARRRRGGRKSGRRGPQRADQETLPAPQLGA